MNHYLFDDIFKGIKTVGEGAGAPFYQGAKGKEKGQFGGQYVGPVKWGPKGGHIKKISPTTGRPIYYKKWSPGQRISPVAQPFEGGSPQGYSAYQSSNKHVIGKTTSGKPIHALSNLNNTRSYAWDDHRDASHAHFSLSHYLMNLLNERRKSGKDTSKLHGLISAHSKFARYHKEEALKDLLHGKQRSASEEDLSGGESRKASRRRPSKKEK